MNDLISIIIPTKNEENNIKICLEAILKQKTQANIEIIIIDSGSTDDTVGVIKEFKIKEKQNIKLFEILSEDFGHGKTRNMGAGLANGDYLVFLNADAIPVDENWLSQLINGFDKEINIAGVFSRHLPKENCHLYMVRDLKKSMPPVSYVRNRKKTLEYMLFSTVSCMIPKEIWNKYPFQDNIIIAEDQYWAGQILKNNLKIGYQANSLVYHSHNYSTKEMYDVKYKVSKSSEDFNSKIPAITLGLFLVISGMTIKILGDIGFIFSRDNNSLSIRQKFVELRIALKARFAGFSGKYVGWISKKDNEANRQRGK